MLGQQRQAVLNDRHFKLNAEKKNTVKVPTKQIDDFELFIVKTRNSP